MKFILYSALAATAMAAACTSVQSMAFGGCVFAVASLEGCEAATAGLDCAKDTDCGENMAKMQKVYDDAGCGGCFPATATVELSNGQIKFMDAVKIGDNVRVGPSEFSEVYLFTSEMSETTSKFAKIAADGAEILMTYNHYLYVNGVLATAGDVKTGDVIQLANGTTSSVSEVSGAWAPGLYNPHTLHGDIIVNGVKTSTYTNAVHPKLAHALLSPLRTMYSAGASFGSGFRSTIKGLPAWLLKAIDA
jgi:hypothetical protein